MKHDWKKVKQAFISGTHQSLEETARAFGIRPSYLRQRAAQEGWSEAQAKVAQKVEEKATELVVRSAAERVAAATERHLQLATMLQRKAVEKLRRVDPESGRDLHRFTKDHEALRALELGVKLEREGLGMTKDEGHGKGQGDAPTGNIHIEQAVLVLDQAGEGARRAFLGALEQALAARAKAVPRA